MDLPAAISWLALGEEYLIKSTAALSLALLLAGLFRKKSAALRHFVLSTFLIGLFFPAGLSFFPTGWESRFSRRRADRGRTGAASVSGQAPDDTRLPTEMDPANGRGGKELTGIPSLGFFPRRAPRRP